MVDNIIIMIIMIIDNDHYNDHNQEVRTSHVVFKKKWCLGIAPNGFISKSRRWLKKERYLGIKKLLRHLTKIAQNMECKLGQLIFNF